jgi:autotransporter-associated beta strand protein
MKPKFKPIQVRRPFLATFSAITLCMSASVMAQTNNNWVGGTSSEWTDGSNWSLGGVPTKALNQHAVINTQAGNIATITLGIIAPVDIVVGTGAGNSGRLDHRSGDAATGSTNWMYVGTNGGTGVFNLADTTGTGGTHSGFATGTGSMTVSGRLYVGGFTAAGSNGVLNMNTTGTLAVGAEMNVSSLGGTGVLNLDLGAVTVNDNLRIGYEAGSKGTLNMSGGSITKTGLNNFIIGGNGTVGVANVSGGTISVNNESWIANGQTAGTKGTLNLTGGTFTANGTLLVGRTGGAGVLNLNGGTVAKQTAGNVVIGARGDGGAANGTVNHDSGGLNMTHSAQLWIANHGNAAAPRSTGTYNLNGGSITLNSWLAIGREGGNGTLNMTGGSITKTGSGSNFIIGTSGSGNSGTMTMSGGTVTVEPSATADRGITWVGESTAGTLTMSGTAEFQTARLTLAVNAAATGTVNLDGGNLRVGQITGGAGNSTFSFDGGQITATGASAAFITGIGTATVDAGGLKIDSSGFNLTVPQFLSGTGGLVKSGAGTLTLTGANTYTGGTAVTGGKLALTTAAGTTGAVTLEDDCALGILQSDIDDSYATSALTFGTFNATTLDFDLGAFAGNTAVAPLNVTGAGGLTLNGAVTVNVADLMPVVGSIPLVSYNGAKGGTGSFTLGSLPDGVSASLVDNGSGLVSLNVTRVNDAYWTGAVDNVWNIGTTANWKDQYSDADSTYLDGDPVLFDDRAFAAGPELAVTLNTTVTPGDSGVTFANIGTNYTLGGTGRIAGTTGLRKEGAGVATITTANTYTGVTTLTGGVLSVPALANGGIASPIGAADSSEGNLVFNGGTLQYTGAATALDRGFTVTGTGGGIDTANQLTISGSIFSTAGNFLKSGAGNLSLTYDGFNVLGGPAASNEVRNGTLTLVGAGFQSFSMGGLWIGSAPGVAAHCILDNTNLSVSGWLAVGRGNGSGATSTLAVTNSTLNTGNFTSGYKPAEVADNDCDQSITLANTVWNNNGAMYLAESDNASCAMTLTNGSSVSLNNTLLLGRTGAESSGSIVLEGASTFTKSATGYISLGVAGTGNLTVKDTSAFVSNGGDFNVSDVANSKGTLNIQDNATVTSAGTLFIGKGDGTAGNLNISGGNLNAALVTIAANTTSTATITQTGGNVVAGAGDRLWMGQNGQATWNQSGGSTTCNGYLVIGRLATSVAAWNVTGGTLTQNPPNPGEYPGVILAEAGTGTLTVSGGGVFDSNGGQINIAAGGGTGTLNIGPGGTVRANQIVEFNVGTSAVNFDGGLLVANAAANASFITGIDTTTVKSGGVTIDSNGQSIAINVALLDGGGNGGLTKTGAGRLQLNAANTYTGATVVSAGTIGGSGSVAGTLAVGASASVAPGTSVGTFSVGATTLAGTYECEIAGAAADVLSVNGNLNLSGASLAVTATAPTGTGWTIATYTGALTGTFASVTAGYTVDYATPGVIKLVQSATPYGLWAAANITAVNPGADATPGGDPDGDGTTNIAEFALNGNPLSGAASGKVVGKVANVGGNPALVLTLPVRSGAVFAGSTEQVSTLIDGVIYRIQGSDGLATWDLAVSEVLGGDKTSIENGMPALDGGWEYRSFQSPGSISGDAAEFLRAVIENP